MSSREKISKAYRKMSVMKHSFDFFFKKKFMYNSVADSEYDFMITFDGGSILADDRLVAHQFQHDGLAPKQAYATVLWNFSWPCSSVLNQY